VTDGPVTVSFINGPIINEARQVFQDWATQTIRLWKGALSADFNFEIGPIPHADGLGKEIISKFTTDLNTDSTWITDSNGRDSMTRKFNSRPTWNLTVYEPTAGNYYPVNAFIATTDIVTGYTISVNTDRSQGGASLADGSVELMVHRRLQADDGRGVGEPLNETGIDGNGLIIRATHRVSFDISNAAASISRRTALADFMWRDNYRYAALVNGITPSSFITAYNVSFSGISTALPKNVHLLTVHAQGPSSILIRVSHSYEVTEDSTMATPASVSLKALFARSKLQLSSCT
jgi:lysosomal alpha-mannosidase